MRKSNSVLIMEYIQENSAASNEKIGHALGLDTAKVRRCIASHVGRGYLKRDDIGGLRLLLVTRAGRNVIDGQRNDFKDTVGKIKMEHPGEAKRRKCLWMDCGVEFDSEGPGDRVCKRCKQTSEYRSAVA